MNGSRNESTVRKMARGKIDFASEWRRCIHFHRKFTWFGKICGSIPLDLQKSFPKCIFCRKTCIKPSFMTVLGEPLGDLGESTVRKMARGKTNFAWEWRRFIHFGREGAWFWRSRGASGTKLDERGLDFDVLGEPRGASGSLGGPSTTTTTHLDIPSPTYPITPRKKHVVRLGSSLI